MLKTTLRAITPPLIYKALASLRRLTTDKAENLFEGDDALFKSIVLKALIYAEYGCGASTLWVFKHTACEIFSVDSAPDWLKHVEQSCGSSPKIHLHHADVGPVKEWGIPVGYSHYTNFIDYTNWIWEQNISPDVILIDGRFRVCCFLTSLLRAKEGAYIFFDDYRDRGEYHIVEQFIRPTQTCGRQTMFLVPSKARTIY